MSSAVPGANKTHLSSWRFDSFPDTCDSAWEAVCDVVGSFCVFFVFDTFRSRLWFQGPLAWTQTVTLFNILTKEGWLYTESTQTLEMVLPVKNRRGDGWQQAHLEPVSMCLIWLQWSLTNPFQVSSLHKKTFAEERLWFLLSWLRMSETWPVSFNCQTFPFVSSTFFLDADREGVDVWMCFSSGNDCMSSGRFQTFFIQKWTPVLVIWTNYAIKQIPSGHKNYI